MEFRFVGRRARPVITTRRRAHLDQIRDTFMASPMKLEDVARANIAVLTWLGHEADVEDALRQLLREAFDLLTNQETRLSLRDWVRTAEPYVRGGR
jgi:predicted transcriptional regulator